MRQTATGVLNPRPAAAGEFPDRDAIRQYQIRALRRLIREVTSGNPFYAPVLREAGINDRIANLDEFVARMPFTEKRRIAEDQRQNPPFGTNLTYPLTAYCRFNQTSATTHGSPLRWLDTAEGWQGMLELWKRVYRAAGITSADRLYFAFSFGPFLGFWTAFEAAAQLAAYPFPAAA